MIRRRIAWILEVLFPSAPDGLMAVADAAGVTAVDEPIPFVPADYPVLTHHEATCAETRRMAALRAHTRDGARDWDEWTSEVSS